jgi:hypothetical protein
MRHLTENEEEISDSSRTSKSTGDAPKPARYPVGEPLAGIPASLIAYVLSWLVSTKSQCDPAWRPLARQI